MVLPLFVPLVHFLQLAAHFATLQLSSLRHLVLDLRVTDRTHRTELLLYSDASHLLSVLLVCFLLFTLRHFRLILELLII